MHSDRKFPSARASEAESSVPPTRQRREAAGTSSGDIAGHADLTASNPGSSGPGRSSHDGHAGPGWPHAASDGDIPDSSTAPARPTFLILVWCCFWAIGAALCVAAVCCCYLIAAAIWGPA